MSHELSTKSIKNWQFVVFENPTLSLLSDVATNSSVDDLLIKRQRKAELTSDVFNVQLDTQGAVNNQKAAGSCWLFATTNLLRLELQKKYNIEKLRLSPSYLFFHDKLEKANFFLNQIVETAEEDVESRLVQHLLTDPISDGGQFGMVANIFEKYGLVPHSVYADSATSLGSARVNQIVTTLLRQYAQELREAVKEGKDTKPLIEKQIERIHQILVVFYGAPPAADEEFTWEYVDKDKKAHSITTTPLKFYKDIISLDASNTVSLLNDPRNDYNRVIHVERLGNVVGAPEVQYLNVEIDLLAEKAIQRLKNNKAVFFGTHTPIYHHNPTGIIDTELWNYEAVGFNPTQKKADRLLYHQSLMTHAMIFVGVHLDEDGKPVRWKVENSWGEDKGNKGYYTLSHEFFKEYVYQVVVEKDEIPDHLQYLETEPIHLPPWDPCGALAQ